MLASRNLSALEARANLEALGSRDGHHGMGQLGRELVKGGLAETGGEVADDAGDGTANGVLGILGLDDALLHTLAGLEVRAASDVLVDLLAGDRLEELEIVLVQGGVALLVLGVVGDGGDVDLADGGNESNDLNAMDLLQVLIGDGASGDTAFIKT